MKKCSKCHIEKEYSSFSKKGLKWKSHCKECISNTRKIKIGWTEPIRAKTREELKKELYTFDYVLNKIKSDDINGIAYSKIQKNIVMDSTNWMPENVSWFQRLYHLKFDKKDIGKCEHCKVNNRRFMDYSSEYSNFCSKECDHKDHLIRRKAYKKKHYEENKEWIIEKIAYRTSLRKDDYNTYQRQYKNMYNKKYPYLAMWRNTLKNSLYRLNQSKEGKTIDLLGYSALELKEHLTNLLQPGMTWDNYGNGPGKWNIDHIKAVTKFDPSTHPSIVNALSNLQPMWSIDNIKKGNK